MSTRKHKIKSKIGKPPGTLLYTGDKSPVNSNIAFTIYNPETFATADKLDFRGLIKELEATDANIPKWININNINDVELIEKIASRFEVHPLVTEDILNTGQRPKVEYYEDYIFVTLKKISPNSENGAIKFDHVSMILFDNLIISFQDEVTDYFSSIYTRIEAGKNIFRKSGTDYLFYVLIDFVVDNYFLVIEELNEKIDTLQTKIFQSPEKKDLNDIQHLKQNLYQIQQNIKPVREILSMLTRQESDLISKSVIIYLNDTYDHQIQLIEQIEVLRESILSVMDLYHSSLSNKMNEVMKILSLIATIFIPLTFIAGIYGMNFEFMPELSWEYGYPVVLAAMLIVGIFLGVYFKKKHWL